MAGFGYPQLRVLALVGCSTRTVLDAVFGPCVSRRDHVRGRASCAACAPGCCCSLTGTSAPAPWPGGSPRRRRTS